MLILGIIGISFGSIFVRLCDAPSLIIAAYRLSIATLVVVPFQFTKGARETQRTRLKEAWFYLFAGSFLAMHFATWIASLQYTSVASSVVLVSTNPIFVAILSTLLLKERLSRRALIGAVIALAGCVWIARFDTRLGASNVKGDLLALAGAVMMAGYLLTGRVVRRGTPLKEYVCRVYGIAAVILVILCAFKEPNWIHFSARTYLFFALSALVPQSIGHTSLNWALRFLPPVIVATCTLFEPVGASLLALAIFKEVLTWQKIAGGLVILTGVFLSMTEIPAAEATV